MRNRRVRRASVVRRGRKNIEPADASPDPGPLSGADYPPSSILVRLGLRPRLGLVDGDLEGEVRRVERRRVELEVVLWVEARAA